MRICRNLSTSISRSEELSPAQPISCMSTWSTRIAESMWTGWRICRSLLRRKFRRLVDVWMGFLDEQGYCMYCLLPSDFALLDFAIPLAYYMNFWLARTIFIGIAKVSSVFIYNLSCMEMIVLNKCLWYNISLRVQALIPTLLDIALDFITF